MVLIFLLWLDEYYQEWLYHIGELGRALQKNLPIGRQGYKKNFLPSLTTTYTYVSRHFIRRYFKFEVNCIFFHFHWIIKCNYLHPHTFPQFLIWIDKLLLNLVRIEWREIELNEFIFSNKVFSIKNCNLNKSILSLRFLWTHFIC